MNATLCVTYPLVLPLPQLPSGLEPPVAVATALLEVEEATVDVEDAIEEDEVDEQVGAT